MKRLIAWMFSDAIERIGYLLSLAGFVFAMTVFAEGVETGNAQKLFWGLLAMALAVVAFWGMEGGKE